MNENSLNPNLNETDLLELTLRLVRYPKDPRTQNAQILTGPIPDQLPVEIPLPEATRVLGSLIRNPESIDMLFDTHPSPEQVLTFYGQRMQAAGWHTSDMYRPNRGGFMSSGSRSRGGNETFYQSLRDPALTVNAVGSASAWGDDGTPNRNGPTFTVHAYPGSGNRTDVRLNLELNSPSPGPPPHRRRRNTLRLLSALEAPEGAKQVGGFGSSNGSNSASSYTTLETSYDLSTLAAHYKTQLEQAGCVLTEEGRNGPVSWMSWTLKDDDELWHGFFFILKVFDQEYHLDLRMKSDNGGKAATEREFS